jgi:TonB-dependent SusC/RagA subfamily outer membrane receptor
MNITMPSRTALLAVLGGLAVALLAGCARSPRAPAPAPEDEVSVGYGTQSKRRVTGAVASISPTEADARVPRLVDLLQGRVPGLEVLRLSGETYSLRIRGGRSIGRNPTDDEPLLVIDDLPVPRGSLSATLAGLAVRDIARIDVLKDAASTSIYGLRGAGGVIIITTKRGP